MARLTQAVAGAVARMVKAAPALPDGVVVYAITDIHGCAGLLDRAFEAIDRDRARIGDGRVVEIYLGDYVDRGPDSRGVIDRLIARRATREVKLLRGNHEALMRAAWDSSARLELWEMNGGVDTMRSYGVVPRLPVSPQNLMVMRGAWKAVFPADHLRFLDELQYSVSLGDYFFVHAGIRPGVALDRQKEEDMLWIRREFLTSRADHGKVVVHGHTPVDEPEFHANRIGIDTGAVKTGRLTCLRLKGTSQEVVSGA